MGWIYFISKRANNVLKPKGIEGIHLIAAGHSPDMSFYPYLWMIGGEILEQKSGHLTKGNTGFQHIIVQKESEP
jgi:multiple sugar transport system substrate-binding protein